MNKKKSEMNHRRTWISTHPDAPLKTSQVEIEVKVNKYRIQIYCVPTF